MADTGPPWNLRFPGPQDFVRETNFYIEDLAEDTAAALSLAGNEGIGPNVVQTVKTDVFTTTSTSYVDITGLTVTITPSSTSSKVLVVVNFGLLYQTGDTAVSVGLRRGTTDIARGDSGGTTAYFITQSADSGAPGEITFLDSPNADTATTYSVQAKVGAATFRLNQDRFGNDIAVSTITAIEVAA